MGIKIGELNSENKCFEDKQKDLEDKQKELEAENERLKTQVQNFPNEQKKTQEMFKELITKVDETCSCSKGTNNLHTMGTTEIFATVIYSLSLSSETTTTTSITTTTKTTIKKNQMFLHRDTQYEYYKVPVKKGTSMTEGKVVETCEKAGLKAVCPGTRKCQYTNEAKCAVTPLSTLGAWNCAYL